MIPEIDFQEGYESREDGVEAPAKRHGIRFDVYSSRLVFLETVEDIAVEDREPSWIQSFVWAIEDSGKKVEELPLGKYAHKLLDLIELSHNALFIQMARAAICDLLDPKVDWKMVDADDRWANHIRYPRLSHLAQKCSDDFRKFQGAMSTFISLPDLSSSNPPKPSPRSYTKSRYA